MELSALIIAIFALILAVPPPFQMIRGRPRPQVQFKEHYKDPEKGFVCEISNPPVRSRILRIMGIRRDPAVITVNFMVSEAGSRRVVVDWTSADLTDLDGDVKTKHLRARLDDDLPVFFFCAMHQPLEGAFVIGVGEGQKIPLLPGRYRFDVEVNCGTTRVIANRALSVGITTNSTYWMP